MIQESFTIIADVRKDQIATLRARLTDLADIGHSFFLDFSLMPQLHFANIVLCEDPEPARFEPFLVFENNIDGSSDDYLAALCTHAAPSLAYIYDCCQGYPAKSGAHTNGLLPYLKARVLKPHASLMGQAGGTVDTIKREQEVHERLQRFLRDRRGCAEPEHIKADIDELADREGLLNGLPDDPTPLVMKAIRDSKRPVLDTVFEPYKRKCIALIAIALLVLAIVLVIMGAIWPNAPILIIWLSRLSRVLLISIVILGGVVAFWLLILKLATRPELERLDDPRRTRMLAEHEAKNPFVQNHLVVTAIVKADRAHLLTLKFVLWAINHLNSGIGKEDIGIHFAQWRLIEKSDCNVLLFLSNYDGGWTHYLDLFIDRAHTGVNAIWGNAMHFPSTRFLLFRGSRDGAMLKATIRKHQHPASVRYSAYPDLPIRNIFNNSLIRYLIGKQIRLFKQYRLSEWVSRF